MCFLFSRHLFCIYSTQSCVAVLSRKVTNKIKKNIGIFCFHFAFESICFGLMCFCRFFCIKFFENKYIFSFRFCQTHTHATCVDDIASTSHRIHLKTTIYSYSVPMVTVQSLATLRIMQNNAQKQCSRFYFLQFVSNVSKMLRITGDTLLRRVKIK